MFTVYQNRPSHGSFRSPGSRAVILNPLQVLSLTELMFTGVLYGQKTHLQNQIAVRRVKLLGAYISYSQVRQQLTYVSTLSFCSFL